MDADEFPVLGFDESGADFKKIIARLQQKAGSHKEAHEKLDHLPFSMGFVKYDPENAEGIDGHLAGAERLYVRRKR